MIEIIPGIFETELNNSGGGTSKVSVFFIPGRAGGRSLLIDAGFANEESKSALLSELKVMGISYDQLDVFITHKHHDHCGLAGQLAELGAAVYMSPLEDRYRYDCLSCHYSHSAMEEQYKVLKTVGITPEREPEIWGKYMEVNERVEQKKRWLFDLEDFPYRPLEEGQCFAGGGYDFTALPLKGHTLGQMGLYDSGKRILFCADQVINGIVPIVGTTRKDEHLLAYFFESLEGIKHRFAGWQIYPAHNGQIVDLAAAVDHIALSYLKKLDYIKRILERKERRMSTKEIACLAYGMNQVPKSDVQFIRLKMVITKTFSCLEYLFEKELVSRTEEDGILYWK